MIISHVGTQRGIIAGPDDSVGPVVPARRAAGAAWPGSPV